MEITNSSQTRLLYNPQLQSAEITEKLFVVRKKQFSLLLNSILKEKVNSIPQHHLIVGQRGMGKTTMLKRLEVELHKEQYRQQFIPLLFREEQYSIQDLAEFWLNCLDALADSLEYEKYSAEMILNIDKTIQNLLKKTPEAISEEAYNYLMDTCGNLHRRPVLLIDNIDIVFSGLDSKNKTKQDQWALRKLLSENGAPIIVSGGVTTTEDVTIYKMPFYDFFKIQYLKRLDYEEFSELLINLATITNSDANVFTTIQQSTSRQKTLLELTGGSPRITVILFDQISKGFSTNINDDLNILADAVTPLYKGKFEELPQQQRTILDAIALNWDAISLRKLALITRMKNNQLSPQLKRLVDDGWIETTPAYKDKGNAYFISERFFNIYYLIRNSSRRHKDKLYCLSKFLEYFYGEEELERISDSLLEQDICNPEQMKIHLALSMIESVKPSKRDQIKEKANNVFLNNEKLRSEFDFAAKDCLSERGYLLFGNQKYQEAIEYFNKAIELNPSDDLCWAFKGVALIYLQLYKEAVDCLEYAIGLNSTVSNFWCNKGTALYCLNRFEEAIICYNEAINLDPYNEINWLLKGDCLLEMKYYEEVLICFNKAIELNPNNSDYWNRKSYVLTDLRRFEEAIDCCDKAIELDANNYFAMCNKGYALIELKRYMESAEVYEQSFSLNSQELSSIFSLIFLYRDKLNNIERAMEIFGSIDEQSLNQDENKDSVPRYYLNKAGFELYNQNKGLAKESLLKAFEILENEDRIAAIANEHWWLKFGSVVIKKDYGSWMLEILEEKGYDIVLSPYYTAIKSLDIEQRENFNKAEIYLNNRAIEISEPARIFIDQIRKYMD